MNEPPRYCHECGARLTVEQVDDGATRCNDCIDSARDRADADDDEPQGERGGE